MDGSLAIRTDPETGDVLYEPMPSPQPAAGGELIARLDQAARDRIVALVTENITQDEGTAEDRETTKAGFFELLGIGKESEPDDEEEAADTSDHPLMLTAWLRFQAKALSALLPTDDTAVRTKPTMDLDEIEDQDERDAAQEAADAAGRRVRAFYTEYLFERLPSYEEDTDQILSDMGLLGLGIRKVSLDRTDKLTPVKADHVPLEDLIVSYYTKNLRLGRLTHRIEMDTNEVIRRVMTGQYRPALLGPPGQLEKPTVTEARDAVFGLGRIDDAETHRIYECYCHLFLDADPHPMGLARPYIVTVHADSQELLAIQRNWAEGDPNETPLEHFVAYIYQAGKNAASGIGLGDLLANVTRALRKAQRRSLEAAYLQNHPSGFKLSSLSVRDESTRVKRGEFMDVDSPTQDIRAAIMAPPFNGPSPGLLTLMEAMEANGKELGGIASIDFAALMKAGVAAGPAMAAFEESTEFQTSVHRRLYKAHRKELKLIHDRMREAFGNQGIPFGDGRKALHSDDLFLVDIIPYMKPGQVSRQKQLLEAQAVYDLSVAMPDIVNRRQAAEDFLRALGRANLDDILVPDPDDEPPQPMDPVSEYSLVLAGKPVAAGLAQNHGAHIDTHAAQMLMLQGSKLPVDQGDAASAVLAAHIAEHMGMQLAVEVAGRIGITPDQFMQLPPEMENQLAPLIAQAAMELEQMRRPPETADPRLQIATIKAGTDAAKIRGDQAKEQMRLRHERELEAMRQRHELELQREKDTAAMDREIEDNTAALQIAKIKGSGSSAGTGTKTAAPAGARSTAKS
jgi:hypothetical protein